MSKEDPKYKKLKNAFLKEFYRAAVENADEDTSEPGGSCQPPDFIN